MATRNPSLDQWMLQQRNRGINTGLGVRGGWGDGMRNDRGLASAMMSDDHYALLLNGQNSNQTRQLRTQADLQRAQEESQFLDSISQQDLGSIYDAPQDPRQAQLQQILNRDFMARERGSRMSMAGTLWNQELERKMAPHNLNVAKFNEERRQFGARQGDREQDRQLKQQSIENSQLYRDAFLEQKKQFQNQNFGLKKDQVQNQNTNRVAGLEIQRGNAATKKEQVARQNTDKEFADFLKVIERGGSTDYMDKTATALFPRLTEPQRMMTLGLMQERSLQGTDAGLTAQRWSQALAQNVNAAISGGGTFDDGLIQTQKEMAKDPNARGKVMYNPGLRRLVPTSQYGQGASTLSTPSMADAIGAQSFASPMDQRFAQGDQLSDAFAPQQLIPMPQFQGSTARRPDGLYRRPDGMVVRVTNGIETPEPNMRSRK